MKLYHVTTEARAKRILTSGMIPGGVLNLTANEIEQDEIEREFAGGFTCTDSRSAICLSYAGQIDMRYGNVVLLISIPDASKLVAFNGDYWEAGSERCAIDDESAEEIRYPEMIPAENIKISRKYTSASTLARF